MKSLVNFATFSKKLLEKNLKIYDLDYLQVEGLLLRHNVVINVAIIIMIPIVYVIWYKETYVLRYVNLSRHQPN